MSWVNIYDGPSPFADMLRDELQARGVQCVVHGAGPFLGIVGDAARTPYSVVRIPEAELDQRREQIEECLAMVQPVPLAEGGSAAE